MTTTQQQAAIERAKRMSELVLEIEEIDTARAKVAKEFRERITQRMKELEDLARDERDGQLRLPEKTGTESLGDALAPFRGAIARIAIAIDSKDAADLALVSEADLMAALGVCPLREDASIEFATDTAGGSVTLDGYVRKGIIAELERRAKPAKKGGKR